MGWSVYCRNCWSSGIVTQPSLRFTETDPTSNIASERQFCGSKDHTSCHFCQQRGKWCYNSDQHCTIEDLKNIPWSETFFLSCNSLTELTHLKLVSGTWQWAHCTSTAPSHQISIQCRLWPILTWCHHLNMDPNLRNATHTLLKVVSETRKHVMYWCVTMTI